MPLLNKAIEKVDFTDKNFIGTITFRSEEITLPNGSKMALGIDDGHWLLVYQENSHAKLQIIKYDQKDNKIFIDQKPSGEEGLKLLKKHVIYFFKHAKTEDLVTLMPSEGNL